MDLPALWTIPFLAQEWTCLHGQRDDLRPSWLAYGDCDWPMDSVAAVNLARPVGKPILAWDIHQDGQVET